MNKDIIYLKEILISIKEIEDFCSRGMDRSDTFFERAVERSISNIGEAANKLSNNITNKYASIPWIDIISFRNRVVHDYFGYDRSFLWTTVEEKLPELKVKVQRILKDIEK